MDWKEFFKPTAWKTAVFVALFLIFSSIIGAQMCWSVIKIKPGPNPASDQDYAPQCQPGLETIFYYYSMHTSGAIASALIFYALTCAIFHIWPVAKKK